MSYELELSKQRATFDRGVVAVNGVLGLVPRSRFLGEPSDGKHTIEILPPFDKGDIHLCIRAALNDATYPRFKSSGQPVKVDYPFVLRR